MKYSACIEMLYEKEYHSFCDRIKQAKLDGLDAIEFWSWTNKDIEEIQKIAIDNKIAIASILVSSDNEMTTKILEQGITAGGDTKKAFKEAITQSCEIAKKLHCNAIIVVSGDEQKNMDRNSQHRNIVEALKYVKSIVEDNDITLLLEPLNAFDHKGYYLTSSEEAFQIIDEVASDNIKLLYDVYHQQITEGNIIYTIKENLEKIGHIHIADVPGRHEPGTGELNYENIIKTLFEEGYSRYIGLEYRPIKPTSQTLDFRI